MPIAPVDLREDPGGHGPTWVGKAPVCTAGKALGPDQGKREAKARAGDGTVTCHNQSYRDIADQYSVTP